MPPFINATTALWALRQVLQFGGIWIVANGYADAGQVADATNALWIAAGGISTLVGFAANIFASFRSKGVANGHQLVNRSSEPAVVLEVGGRNPELDAVDYPDIDLMIAGDGDTAYRHKDGTPYETGPGRVT